MEITEVRIKLMEEPGERLKAFCSITFDNCFVVRDLKIIDGTSGPFVAMPSRKLTSHCAQCGTKNHLRAEHCNHCGSQLKETRAPKDSEGRAKLYADIAHPINASCREMIQDRVIRDYLEEIERAQQPDYVSRYDDFDYEGAEGGKGRPARIDSAHKHASAEKPHLPAQSPSSEETVSGGSKPHFPTKMETEKMGQADAPQSNRTTNGNFGAGIFPE